MPPIVINGHFRAQVITGVQRYAHEIIRVLDPEKHPYRYVEPPALLDSDMVRQLWMQSVMPFKMGSNELLWSPTNIGPMAKKNQVITLHDIADCLYPEWFDPKYVQWRSLILPRLLKRVKGIITVSEYSKETILEQFPASEGKIKVIYNGVRTDQFYPRNENETAALQKRFGLTKPFIITVGSFDPRKNINGLLKVWNQLPPTFKHEIELVVVGGEAQTFSFRIDEEVDESVHFLGYVADEALPGLYSMAEAFIYPSFFEGFGLPVLEAMACRTPVITSGTTALKELAEGYAEMVDPHNEDEIAEAILRLMNSDELQNKLAEKGYQYVQQFQWKRSAKKTYKFLRKKQQE